ncbi:hypothetical protein S7711_02265 [Stachybotrys chartarum IBT 7711]|uniref:Uncharacterized protein n=1 Tax=Stachybotrys chartarum (strain CBS 109288 / IBT 7711) TaxID=1280523 RepID=A0A084AZD6_STACB|nr:hypothetical protein S7711_02265 [Stachybotrys chartarum IBT 7711]KFA53075.1 hypothetical protein S40293_05299 [Stachybotrys chartarum IBT 40293]KFA71922.1 hypothetical protein S40288_08740 [Stachybotrys chartarum IBT 40288]
MNSADIFGRQYWGGCQYGYHRSGSACVRNSDWYYWGRWVLAGVVALVLIATLIICSCVARRRRRRGATPFYGTGWMAAGRKYGGNNHNNGYNMNSYQPTYPQYNAPNNTQGWSNPPPAYGQQQPQYTGSTFSPSDGYYGNGQTNGVQPPPTTYQRDGAFSPPPGPPPGKV